VQFRATFAARGGFRAPNTKLPRDSRRPTSNCSYQPSRTGRRSCASSSVGHRFPPTGVAEFSPPFSLTCCQIAAIVIGPSAFCSSSRRIRRNAKTRNDRSAMSRDAIVRMPFPTSSAPWPMGSNACIVEAWRVLAKKLVGGLLGGETFPDQIAELIPNIAGGIVGKDRSSPRTPQVPPLGFMWPRGTARNPSRITKSTVKWPRASVIVGKKCCWACDVETICERQRVLMSLVLMS
jgi:hypothetical protein